MALFENGKCSCGGEVPFTKKYNISLPGGCGPVCPGEQDVGPTRYCGTVLLTAVYRLAPDEVILFNQTFPPIEKNISIPPNVTILNVTEIPDIEIIPPPPPDPTLQYTAPENFREAADGLGSDSESRFLLELDAG